MAAFDLTILNTDLDPKAPQIFTGVETTLNLLLVNNSGSEATLTSASWIKLVFPSFLNNSMEDMTITALSEPDDWNCEFKPGSPNYFKLAYTGDEMSVPNEGLSFDIKNVVTNDAPEDGGKVSVTTNEINEINKPSDTLLDLLSPFPFELDEMLAVYISSPAEVFYPSDGGDLKNTIRLNFLNIRQDRKAFFNGTDMNSPQVKVTFDCGTNTQENLTTETKAKENITMRQVGGSVAWKVEDATAQTHGSDIYWLLTPQELNIIEGAENDGNQSITIEIDNIIPNNTEGTTIMHVELINFPKDYASSVDDTYNHIFTLPIEKSPTAEVEFEITPSYCVPNPQIKIHLNPNNQVSNVSLKVNDSDYIPLKSSIYANDDGIGILDIDYDTFCDKAKLWSSNLPELSDTCDYTFNLRTEIAEIDGSQNILIERYPGPAKIGDYRYGGVVFWVDPDDNCHGLACALKDYKTKVKWLGTDMVLPSLPLGIIEENDITGEWGPGGPGTEIGDGESNTNAILKDCPEAPAALAARELGDEWFLPSIDELSEIYNNRAILEAVPEFSPFIAFTQYWSSSLLDYCYFEEPYVYYDAWVQFFLKKGGQNYYNIVYAEFSVRAVRAF